MLIKRLLRALNVSTTGKTGTDVKLHYSLNHFDALLKVFRCVLNIALLTVYLCTHEYRRDIKKKNTHVCICSPAC